MGKLQHHEMKKQWKLVLHTQVRTACVQQLSSNDILRILNQKQKVFQVILTSEWNSVNTPTGIFFEQFKSSGGTSGTLSNDPECLVG